LNLPVGVAALALSPVLLPESRDRTRTRSFDPAGAATITGALVLLVYAIFTAPDVGWGSPRTIGLLAASVALVASFVLVQRRSAAPLVPLRLFWTPTVAGGNLVIFAIGMAVDATLFTLTLYAQQVLGYSAAQFGLMTSVMTVMAIVGALAGQSI